MKNQSAPPYVFQRGNLYFFRWTFPHPLAEAIGKRELRRSLGTGYKAVARRRAMALAVRLQSLAAKFLTMRDITPQNLHALLDHYFLEALNDREQWRSGATGLSGQDVENELTALNYMQEDTRRRLRHHDYSGLKSVVAQLSGDWGVAPPTEDSELYKLLCRGLLRTDASVLQVELNRTVGDYSDDIALNATPRQSVFMPAGASRLSEVIKKFTDEMEKAEFWNERTKIDNNAIFRDFIEVVGNGAIASITRDAVIVFRDLVVKMPARRQNDPRYSGLSIQKIAQLPDVKPIALRTANKFFTRLSQFFGWAKDKSYVTENLAANLLLKENKRKKKHAARDAFDKADLERIFFNDIFQSVRNVKQYRRPYMHWLPLIALFTGSRIEEIATLKTSDLYQVDGVWVFDINTIAIDGGDKSLKTVAAERKLAVHPTLIALGLLDFVEYRKLRGDADMFPDLPVRKIGKRGPTASNWFARYLTQLGLTSEREVFHSFRHTFINYLKQNGVAEDIAKELAGHEGGSVTYHIYGKPLWPIKQYEILDQKLDYYQIDFSPLNDFWRQLIVRWDSRSFKIHRKPKPKEDSVVST